MREGLTESARQKASGKLPSLLNMFYFAKVAKLREEITVCRCYRLRRYVPRDWFVLICNIYGPICLIAVTD